MTRTEYENNVRMNPKTTYALYDKYVLTGINMTMGTILVYMVPDEFQ